MEKAELIWAAAQTARVELQQSQATVREHAVAFNRELIALRRILRATVGTHHLDYQTLRTSRVLPVGAEESDESVVEDVPTDAHPLTTPVASNGASSNGASHAAALAQGVSA